MKKTFTIMAAALVALSVAVPATASDEGQIDQATRDKVTALLAADGYEVRKIEMEDGMVEAYAVKDGKTYEIYFDADLKIVKTDES